MTKRPWHMIGAALLLFSLPQCTTDPAASVRETPLQGPAHFVQLVEDAANPFSPEKAALGQMLFFDPVLSKDSTLSCSSCHLPERAFTDGKAIAVGVDNLEGTRNAPSLVNLAWITEGLFWDGRSPTLEEQAVHPVINPNELGSDWLRCCLVWKRIRNIPPTLRRYLEKASHSRQLSMRWRTFSGA